MQDDGHTTSGLLVGNDTEAELSHSKELSSDKNGGGNLVGGAVWNDDADVKRSPYTNPNQRHHSENKKRQPFGHDSDSDDGLMLWNGNASNQTSRQGEGEDNREEEGGDILVALVEGDLQ